jgi:hypothetical protein
MRDVRNELAALSTKARHLSKVKGFRTIAKNVAASIDETVCDIDGWMGWDDD